MTEPSIVADLHMHSQCSDGRQRPADVMHTMANHGLRVVALTDHDTLDGWSEAADAAKACGLTIITGIELSVTLGEAEVHLLGYGFDVHHPGIQAHVDAFRTARTERAEAMVDRLQAEGISISMDDVWAEAQGSRALGRPHVAAALRACGAVDTHQEAFDQYLGDGHPAFVPKPPVPAADAISMLHAANGIAVLAHPGQWTSAAQLRRLVEAGLDGVEVVHPSHPPYLQRYYEQQAENYGLLVTGGSDDHGRPADADRLGTIGLTMLQWERIRDAIAYEGKCRPE